MSAAVPRILVIRRRYLGDIVLLGPVFRNLRLHWPGARLALVVEPAYAGVLELNADVDTVLRLPRRTAEWPRFLRAVRDGGFSHVLDFDNTQKTALVARWSGAPARLTLRRDGHRLILPQLYSQVVAVSPADDAGRHITETCLDLVRAIDVPIATREVRLTPRPDDLAFVDALLGAGPRPGLLVHPGSRSTFRLWPPDRFAAVLDRVREELGVAAAVVAGPAELPLARDIACRCRHRPAVIDCTLSIPRLAAVFRRVPVLLCHDSGPMHLAAAVGARVIALYGSQNATIWRPSGEGHTVLQTPLPCHCLPDAPVPCVRHDAYRSYCVRKLGVDEVWTAVAAALRR